MTSSAADPIAPLIERAVRGETTPEELALLADWRRASAANEAAYLRTVRLLEAARALGRAPAGVHVPDAAALLAHDRATQAVPIHRAPRTPVPGTRGRAERGAGGTIVAWLPWGMAAAALLALVVRQPAALPGAAPEIRTGQAELATVHLDDGTVVRLAPSTRLQVIPHEDMREVRLDGRAHFSVAEDAHRPFRVQTDAGHVDVLGTRFDIDATDARLDLIVVEGKVSLSAGGSLVEVSGGEISGVVDGTLVMPHRVVNADSVLRWVGTFIVFRSTPLEQAARELERVYDLRVSITDPAIARRTVTATFADQDPRDVADVLCTIVDARCTVAGEQLTISR